MTAGEILITNILETTGDPALERALAQQHTLAYWLAHGVVIVDRARVDEARQTVEGR